LEDDVPKLSRPIPETTDELLETGLLDSWYLVCRDVEIGTKPIGLKRLNRNIVLWRNREGKVEAVDDFCPHRGAKLSLGHVCDGEIACEYHGVQVNGKGVVTATPPQPDSGMVGRKLLTSYPAEERHGGIWLYFSLGDRDEEPPPLRFPDEFESGEWQGFLDMREFGCNWQLVRDNQFDPVHGSYLHVGTHALQAGQKAADMGYEKTERGFVVWRKNQQGVNLDKTWLEYYDHSGFWAISDIPYPKKECGGLGRLFRYPTPIDRQNTLVWNYRMMRHQGWKRDAWRFLYRNRASDHGAVVLEQDRVALGAIEFEPWQKETLLQCDIGVSHIRRLYRAKAEEQLKAVRSQIAAE
jgi:phenylpropionate dioxygenase-like ring-hydroxylating dioxygenase large terminal subunit